MLSSPYFLLITYLHLDLLCTNWSSPTFALLSGRTVCAKHRQNAAWNHGRVPLVVLYDMSNEAFQLLSRGGVSLNKSRFVASLFRFNVRFPRYVFVGLI
jgi:hypothetical protein